MSNVSHKRNKIWPILTLATLAFFLVAGIYFVVAQTRESKRLERALIDDVVALSDRLRCSPPCTSDLQISGAYEIADDRQIGADQRRHALACLGGRCAAGCGLALRLSRGTCPCFVPGDWFAL